MKVFFDFYEIALGKGKSIGIYNYAFAVLENLSKIGDIEITVGCNGENITSIREIAGIEVIVISPSFPTIKQRLFWRFFKAINVTKKIKADIYYSPKGFAPGLFKRTRKPFIILTIHDLIPFFYNLNYPKYFSRFENHVITKSLAHSLRIANSVITISNFSKQMIEECCKKRSNIYVIYNGVSVFKIGENRGSEKPYIFSVTSMLPHKNQLNLINGYLEYRKISPFPLPLIVCGIKSEQLNISEEFIKYITCIPFADESNFSRLFSNASLFLFLPIIEGFGFPPLESLMHQVPVIASDIPVLREVLGNSAYFLNHESPIEIAKGIMEVLSDEKIQKDIIMNGKNTLQKYTWTNCCNQILKVFEKTII